MQIGLSLDLTAVELARHPGRGRCRACSRRRVLFSLVASSAGRQIAESDRKCAECAGIVAGDRPVDLDDAILSGVDLANGADSTIVVTIRADDSPEVIDAKIAGAIRPVREALDRAGAIGEAFALDEDR